MFIHSPLDVNNYSRGGKAEDGSREGEENDMSKKGRTGQNKEERGAVVRTNGGRRKEKGIRK